MSLAPPLTELHGYLVADLGRRVDAEAAHLAEVDQGPWGAARSAVALGLCMVGVREDE